MALNAVELAFQTGDRGGVKGRGGHGGGGKANAANQFDSVSGAPLASPRSTPGVHRGDDAGRGT